MVMSHNVKPHNRYKLVNFRVKMAVDMKLIFFSYCQKFLLPHFLDSTKCFLKALMRSLRLLLRCNIIFEVTKFCTSRG